MGWTLTEPPETNAKDIADLIGRYVLVEISGCDKSFAGTLAAANDQWLTLHDAVVDMPEADLYALPPRLFVMTDISLPVNRVLFCGEVHADVRGWARQRREFLGFKDQPHAFVETADPDGMDTGDVK
jgi:hypothetical protein